ncbi:putative nuclease HARBI1 [Phlebotomus papatasi]|uniref:putative nuclease HARBI1 n=1 Tax=Phlebotomus papatasi TaxID=29031 RepID=UPI0024835A7C|nr:putative nuclease HARBI1 [Phlebotomus papatasi]
MFPAMLQFLLLEEMYQEELSNQRSQKRRKIRKQTAMELPDSQFIKKYGITKGMFSEIMNMIEDDIPMPSRVSSYSKATQVLSVLKWLASGELQSEVTKDVTVAGSQSSISKIINRILPILERKICPAFVLWPKSKDKRKRIRNGFLEKWSSPLTIGIIACTHVEIGKPDNAHLHMNQYDKYSMNVSLICDDEGKFMAVDATHPGATHNSEIWSISEERQFMEDLYDDGGEKCWLLGDKAYPLEPWLISPYRTYSQEDIEFNKKFTSIRSVMTRNIGILKSRWKVLSNILNYSPEKIIRIVNVCVALHNMCKMHNLPDFEIDPKLPEEESVEFDEVDTVHEDAESLREEGAVNREYIKKMIMI